MKKTIFALLSALFVFAGSAKAYEGSISISGNNVACKASSVWHESRYRVIGRCEGLVYPYATQYEYYTIWAHDVSRQSYVRIDDIDRGYFEGDVTSPFDKLLITAETDGGPRRPSEKTVATGTVEKFAFDKSQVVAESSNETAVKTTDNNTNKTVSVQSKTTTAKASTTSNTGSVVGRIITSLIVIILVVVGIVIAGSLLFRSRGSVSA